MTYKRPPQWWRHRGLLKAAVEHVDALIAPSLFSKEIHHKMGLDLPVVHLPFFVPTDSMKPTGQFLREESEKPYFLFVGRLEKLKGLQTLIPVFRQYQKVQLLIAGVGSYEPRLRQLAEGASNIHFLGHKDERELQVLYRRAMAVIVPSICYEASPLVTFEAFRQQTPVIVRNLGGMAETIQESGGGFIYNTDGSWSQRWTNF